ncbi:MAG: hypothetical protein KGM98_06545 [Bacteroidota bacterium]|nr:hypothetical protein [Bacteroidota bacterium]
MHFIEMVTGTGGAEYFGVQRFSYNEGYVRVHNDRLCDKGCFFESAIATGDTLFNSPTGFDHAADAARRRQV